MKVVGRLKAILGLDKKKFDRGLKDAKRQTSAFGGAIKKLGGILAGVFAFTKIFQGIKKFIGLNAEFGQSLANLSAITGATGKDLAFYEQQAKQIGKTTTLSASQAVKAFELMGSARPELLKNKEALAAVTREAVILAEASGLDLPTATQALAKAMNQFNIPANEAARVINVLAAGSKEGAEAIPGLTDAIKVMGTAAAMADISLEQTVGMIETLAEKGLSGAESGTQLRNVILKLQSEADRFNPKVVGMSKALENLGNANYSAAKLTEMFGLRNQQAAAILIQNREKFEKYTQAVTGTTVAYEQQSKKVDTIKGHWKSFMSVLESAFLKGDKFRSMIINVIDYMTKTVPEIVQKFHRFKVAIVGVINYFIDLYNESAFFRGAIEGIVFAFKTFKTVARTTFTATVSMFQGLGKIFKDIFTGKWDEIGKHADEAFVQVVEDAKAMGEEISENWKRMMENIKERNNKRRRGSSSRSRTNKTGF
jgi:TP901 family phage tail tape measure protein